MIRYLKLYLFIFFILTAFCGFSQEMNLLNTENTESFAKYLLNTKQYKFAAQEYERLIFLNPQNINYKKELLLSYRNSGDYLQGLKTYKLFVSEDNNMGDIFLIEYVKLNILGGYADSIYSLLQTLNNENIYKPDITLTYNLITKNWDNLPEKNDSGYNAGLIQLSAEISDIRYKSPFAAGAFSTVIPGAGKFYTGRWKDGLVSFLFVGLTSYQAYRGFNKKGTDSVYGWVLGGISFGFYVGNIFGSVKSAKLYNTNLQDAYVKKAGDYFIDKY
ncbi:MAG: hypothetical protein JXJ22_11115 [Bacteroidales bacterium]|nr:hypothetical protein [Bacteroidales bacterium]